MEIHVLDVRDRDKVKQLHDLLQEGFFVDIPVEKLEDRLLAIKPDVYYIMADGEMVSAAFADVKPSYTRSSYILEINYLVTAQEYRGLGFGKAIVDRIIQDAGNAYYKVMLTCVDENVNFYKKCGFARFGVEMRLIR